MNAMYEYMSDFEYGIAALEATANAAFSELDTMFEKVSLKHQENLLAIEAKILHENGTDDDMAMLYQEEANDTNEQKSGVLSKIFTAIKTFIQKIKKAIFGEDSKDATYPAEVEVPENPQEVMKDADTCLKAGRAILGGAIGATAIGAVTAIIHHQKSDKGYKMSGEQAKKSMSETEKKLDELQNMTDQMETKLKDMKDEKTIEAAKTITKGMQSTLTRISECDSAIYSKREVQGPNKAEMIEDKYTKKLNLLLDERDSMYAERKKLINKPMFMSEEKWKTKTKELDTKLRAKDKEIDQTVKQMQGEIRNAKIAENVKSSWNSLIAKAKSVTSRK